jgi:RNA polymerase sigma-70 factor (ECF subfamily)
MPDPLRERDATLVASIAAREQSAVAEVYRLYGATMLSLARGITGDEALAQDATQDVFVRLWRDPARYDSTRAGLRSFLLLQVRGRALDVARSERARRQRERRVALGESDSIDDEFAALVETERLLGALAALPALERQAIEIAYFGGLTYREVAELLGQAEGTVKSRIRSGLHRLRGLLLAEAS